MRDLSLQASGALAIFVAIIHGAIAELRVFPKVRIESQGADTAAEALARRRPRLDLHWRFADGNARGRERPPAGGL